MKERLSRYGQTQEQKPKVYCDKNWKSFLGYETKGNEPKVFDEFTKPV